jgi:hypothetical protein
MRSGSAGRGATGLDFFDDRRDAQGTTSSANDDVPGRSAPLKKRYTASEI